MGNLKVGDTLFVHIKGRITNDALKEVRIKKVGRVYYELNDSIYKRVKKDSLRYDDPEYSHRSFQAFKDRRE